MDEAEIPLLIARLPMRERPKIPRARARLSERLLLWISKGRRIDGLWVGTAADESSPVLRPVEEAHGLIKRYDRIRYDRLVHDFDRVWVRVLPAARGSFNYLLNACQIDERHVLADATRPELIALTIVHEATHARLMRCGIGYEEKLRARVEAVCARRELAFAAKLPDGQQAHAEAALDLTYSPDIWSDASRQAQIDEDAPAALRHLGVPEWLIRFIMVKAPYSRKAVRMARRLRGMAGKVRRRRS
ncbi:MAG TPA: hypothetical protein VN668_03595 [Stellaceae bacterium]|nr:hypothetical protein [Stellaceae bacterium]